MGALAVLALVTFKGRACGLASARSEGEVGRMARPPPQQCYEPLKDKRGAAPAGRLRYAG
jgi:hypothetical protein